MNYIKEKCPFCGGKVYETGAPIIYVKECTVCGAHQDMEENKFIWSK